MTWCDIGLHSYAITKSDHLMLSDYEVHRAVCRRCGKVQIKEGHREYLWLENWEPDGFIEDFEEVTKEIDKRNHEEEEAEKRARRARSNRVYRKGEFKI